MNYSYDYNYGTTVGTGAGAISAAAAIPTIIISLGMSIVMIVALWKIFEKCGEEGWKSIIPIYNIIVLFQIVGLKPWYIALVLIPCVGPFIVMVFMYMAYVKLAKKLGKTTTGFAVLTVLFTPIALIILAFDKNCVVQNNIQQQPMMQQQVNGFPQQEMNYNNNQSPVNNMPNSPVQPVSMNEQQPVQPVSMNEQQPVQPSSIPNSPVSENQFANTNVQVDNQINNNQNQQ